MNLLKMLTISIWLSFKQEVKPQHRGEASHTQRTSPLNHKDSPRKRRFLGGVGHSHGLLPTPRPYAQRCVSGQVSSSPWKYRQRQILQWNLFMTGVIMKQYNQFKFLNNWVGSLKAASPDFHCLPIKECVLNPKCLMRGNDKRQMTVFIPNGNTVVEGCRV